MRNSDIISFDFTKTVEPEESFRVKSVQGTFGMQTRVIKEHFKGEFTLPEEWNIGVIVGNSGTGKTSIAKKVFADEYIDGFDWPNDNILDDMPESASVEDITTMFNAVGFSSPPSWLKPFEVLSDGEKMRVRLARALLSENERIVFDEFTSVVDRNIAQIGSHATQKAVRREGKQFIAVTCHFDIIDWLQPDWVFDTNKMSFTDMADRKKKKGQKSMSNLSKRPTKTFGESLQSITI